jgi:hypothetical protein
MTGGAILASVDGVTDIRTYRHHRFTRFIRINRHH